MIWSPGGTYETHEILVTINGQTVANTTLSTLYAAKNEASRIMRLRMGRARRVVVR